MNKYRYPLYLSKITDGLLEIIFKKIKIPIENMARRKKKQANHTREYPQIIRNANKTTIIYNKSLIR